jgi:hypothetical protein
VRNLLGDQQINNMKSSYQLSAVSYQRSGAPRGRDFFAPDLASGVHRLLHYSTHQTNLQASRHASAGGSL